MNEIVNDKTREENTNKDCGCDDGCCQPKKKKNHLTTILFSVILIAAVAIIGIRMAGRTGSGTDKQSATPGKASCMDTSKSKTCDTAKGSSCCPKK
jgi:hypothetical protein